MRGAWRRAGGGRRQREHEPGADGAAADRARDAGQSRRRPRGRRGHGGRGGGLDDLLGQVLGRGAGSGAGGGQGLEDLLGQVLGGGRAGPGAGGGLGDLLDAFQRAGYGEQSRSWVGAGRNEPVPPDALERVFGHDALSQIAARAGLSERETSEGLSQLLPEVVDKVTPDGRVPDFDALVASVSDMARRMR
ncbi:MAG: YidB family protein [Burkholderiales bacterium]|nr:YidB family protein [Burkholderiales bacterium]